MSKVSGHRSTSNLGTKSYVFGASEHSMGTAGAADTEHTHASNGGVASRQGGGQAGGRLTSFAGVKGMLGAGGAGAGAGVGGVGVSITKKESSSLFTLLESSSKQQL